MCVPRCVNCRQSVTDCLSAIREASWISSVFLDVSLLYCLTVMERYQLIRPLGKGTLFNTVLLCAGKFSVVYEARDLTTGFPVAFKKVQVWLDCGALPLLLSPSDFRDDGSAGAGRMQT